VKPTSIPDLSDAVRQLDQVEIVGAGTKRMFGLPIGGKPRMLDLTGLTGIVEIWEEDQVAVARAGTPLEELQEALKAKGQCLPYPDPEMFGPHIAGFPGTVGGLVAMNLPHGLYAQCGGPRDWVLGLTLIRGNGAIAKCGSHAVKNVAGYDVQKLLVGSRGALGLIAEVIFRTYPLRALPSPDVRALRQLDKRPVWIQRTLPMNFQNAWKAIPQENIFAYDPASSTIWAWCKTTGELPRYPEDWVLRGGCGPGNFSIDNKNTAKLMKRAKSALDPENKFNPGVMGVV